MKTPFRNASIAFALGAVTSATILSWVRDRDPSFINCRTGDLVPTVVGDAAKSLESGDYAWIRNARQCDIGAYSVATPLESGRAAVFVVRNGEVRRPVFAATADSTNLFDPEGKRGLRGLLVQSEPHATAIFNVDGSGQLLMVTDESIALIDRATKRDLVSVDHLRSGTRRLSYTIYNKSQAAWVENTVGPDGNVDLRKSEIPGRPAKTEVRVGERWLEYVQRGNQVGTIVDGQFMSLPDAIAKLRLKPTVIEPK
jgi:hypothetical protein